MLESFVGTSMVYIEYIFHELLHSSTAVHIDMVYGCCKCKTDATVVSVYIKT